MNYRYFEVLCWECNSLIAWKTDYSCPMPSLVCESCKCREEEGEEEDES